MLTMIACAAASLPAGEPLPAEAIPAREYEIRLSPPDKTPVWGNRRVGVASFYHAGFANPDGSDIVVRDAEGLLNHKVIQAGPGDFLRITFEFRNPKNISILFGVKNDGESKAEPANDALSIPPAKSDWEPTSGLLLTTLPLPSGMNADNFAEMEKILKKVKDGPVYGTDFVDRVYHGYNYFSTSEDPFVSIYEGWLGCGVDGAYTFATSSDDASFLLVDGKLIVDWPGGHGARWDAKYNKTIDLKKGIHKFAYYHVNFAGPSITCAAWKYPGMNKPEPIAAESFAPVSRFTPGEISHNGTGIGTIAIENKGECMVNGVHMMRYMVSTSSQKRAAKVTVDFGDGVSTPLVKGEANHVYLSPALRSISVKGDGIDQTNRASISFSPQRQIQQELDRPKNYLKTIAAYPFDRMHKNDNGKIIEALLPENAYRDQTISACKAMLARADLNDKELYDTSITLGQLLRETPADKPQEALAVYRAAIKKLEKNRKYIARLTRESGDTLLYYIKDPDAALNEYDKVVGRYADVLEDNIVRITKIKIGDIYRQKGKGEKARKIYTEAAEMILYKRSFAQDTVRKGALYKAVDDFLKRNETDAAKNWLEILEWEYPMEKMDGYSSIMRARIAIAENNDAEAIKQFLLFVTASPQSTYAPEAFFRCATLFKKIGKPEEAARIGRKIIENYPDSSYALEAKIFTN
ncbi:MAG: hypothetical protein JXR97_13430 [Planctomycetes bacterium]|nr:hypothetical protein [Planctomycetota bacterium]